MTITHDQFGPEEIVILPRLRAEVNEGAVIAMMTSIQEIGLQTPITIRMGQDSDGDPIPVLVTGKHRLEACTRLGYQSVECTIFHGTEIEARKWEISENLHRADLTVMERAVHIAEWIRLTIEEAKETAVTSCYGSLSDGRKSGPQHQQHGVRAAVRDLGVGHMEASRSMRIDKLSDAAKQTASAIGLADNQSALLRAAASENPVAELEKIRDEKLSSEERPDYSKEFAEYLRDNIPSADAPMVMTWFLGTSPRKVVKAWRGLIG